MGYLWPGEMLYKAPESVAEWKEKYYNLLDLKITVHNPELKKSDDVVTIGHRDELTIAAEDETPLTKHPKR